MITLIGRKKGIYLMLILLVVFCLNGVARAAVYFVDKTVEYDENNDGTSWNLAFNTIGAAIGKANDGDTVRVAEGTYRENIRIKGDLTILGGHPAGGGARDTSQFPTIIDGSNNNSSVVVARNASGLIAGFIIRNGNKSGSGGGVVVVNSSIMIVDNLIFSNKATSGGGIFAKNYTGEISCNTISANFALRGGGSYINESSPNIRNNIFNNNIASMAGGGIYISTDRGNDGMIEANSFVGNSSGTGGALYVIGSKIPITRNIIENNTAEAFGGGIYLNSYDGIVEDCLMVLNRANKAGAAIFTVALGTNALFSHVTIADNITSATSPAIFSDSGITIQDSIIWNGTYDFITKGIVNISNSDVSDGQYTDGQYANSNGVISVDPLFNPDYSLPDTSPVFDMDMGPVSLMGPDTECSVKAGGDCEGPEVCDGVDNDCDGATDEGGNVLCNDNDPCTVDSCDSVEGVCVNVAGESGFQDDVANIKAVIQGFINSLDEDNKYCTEFKKEECRYGETMIKKLQAVEYAIKSADDMCNRPALQKKLYRGARKKLKQDLLLKCDGCVKKGEPDSRDWIINCDAQNQVYSLIHDLINKLNN